MRRTLGAALAALLLALPAAAQDVRYGPPSPVGVGLTPYSPQAYGAVCDSTGSGGGTNDTTALNAMFAAIRAANKPFIVDSAGKTCYHTGTLNLTGFTSFGDNLYPSVIKLKLDCRVNAGPCIDALGSRFIRFDHLYLYGEQTTGPTYGIQLGKIGANNADNHVFEQPYISGYFTKAAIYNFASETFTINAPFIQNNDAGASYGLILDGCNHWNITSALVTETIAADTCQSFNGQTFLSGWIGGQTPWWIEGVYGLQAVGGYSPGAVGGNGALLYMPASGRPNVRIAFDQWHFETSPADTFLITGGVAGATIEGFTYKDYLGQATNSLFKLGGSVVAVQMRDLNIKVDNFAGGAKVFDSPSAISVFGNSDIWVPVAANWSAYPPTFTGTVCSTDGGCAVTASKVNKWTLTAPTTAATLTAGADNVTYTGPAASKTLMASDYSNGTTLTANALLTGGGAGAAPNAVALTGLAKGNGASAPTAYAGTSCTNQFPRALDLNGAATCASVANADLAGSIATTKLDMTLGVAAAGGFTVSPRNIGTCGVGHVSGAGTYTSQTPAATEVYIAEVFVPSNVTITGVAVLNSATISGNMKVGLANSSGVNVATSASTAMSGTSAYQRVPFTGTYAAVGPATYYVEVFYDNATARPNSLTTADCGAAKQTGQTYATGFTTITAPTTFTTALGPVAGLY